MQGHGHGRDGDYDEDGTAPALTRTPGLRVVANEELHVRTSSRIMLALVDHHLVQLTPQAGRASVPVSVVHIGHMRMNMVQRLVAMAVAVRTFGHRLVPVIVVPIVVPMRVFVLHGFVSMLVAVRLRQVQHDPDQHQYAAQRHPAAGRARRRTAAPGPRR